MILHDLIMLLLLVVDIIDDISSERLRTRCLQVVELLVFYVVAT